MTLRLHRFFVPFALALAFVLLPLEVDAVLTISTGTSFTFWGIITRIIAYMAGAIAAVAMAMFTVGAFFVTISGAKEDYKQKGKDLMIGAVLSLAVVFGAYAILRTIDYFLTS